MGRRLSVARGLDAEIRLRVVNADGTPRAGLLASDALAAKVWAGDDLDVLATPTAAWVDAGAAEYKVTFPAAQTAGLTPGTYQLLVTLTRGGRTIDAGRAPLAVLPTPGLGTARRTYCSYDDMIRRSPVLRDLQEDSDQAGFAEQRAEAADWLEGIALARMGPAYAFGNGIGGPVGADWYRGEFEAGRLAIRKAPAVRRIAAAYAAHLVLKAQVGDSRYESEAHALYHEATGDVASLVAEVEDADGTTRHRVDCGTTRPRWC